MTPYVAIPPQVLYSLESSEWEGMSGAVVFTKDPVHGDRAIGVIVEHHLPEGTSSLTVVPITAISDKLDDPTARQWWSLLNVRDPHELPHLPLEPEGELVAAEAMYRQQVIQEYNRLSFSGFELGNASLAEVSLEEVFVRLSLTVKKKINQKPVLPQEEHTGTRHPDQQRERKDIEQKEMEVQEPITLGDALNTNILLIGDPGAGKSTLLRWLAVTFAHQDQANRLRASAHPNWLPVLIELGHLPAHELAPGGGATQWKKYLPGYITGQDAFSGTPASLLTQALNTGRCLLLFDGLDEVADQQTRFHLVQSLADLVRHISPGNRIVIGSRPAGIGDIPNGVWQHAYRRCQIMPFTSDDMQRFFHFWGGLSSTNGTGYNDKKMLLFCFSCSFGSTGVWMRKDAELARALQTVTG